MPPGSKKVSSKRFADKQSKSSPSIVDALIEGERRGKSNKKIKDIMAVAKKKLKKLLTPALFPYLNFLP